MSEFSVVGGCPLRSAGWKADRREDCNKTKHTFKICKRSPTEHTET